MVNLLKEQGHTKKITRETLTENYESFGLRKYRINEALRAF